MRLFVPRLAWMLRTTHSLISVDVLPMSSVHAMHEYSTAPTLILLAGYDCGFGVAIAAFLDNETAKFDSLTSEANRAIALLQERRSALISAAVTGKIDVREVVIPARHPGENRGGIQPDYVSA